ncbi:chromosome partitioning protein ParB, partial [Streptococcus pneumoniae]|nr:chromosome partitioning protein ParB [Streptococcus pneumoniae]
TNHFIQNEEKQLRKLLGLDVEIKLSKKDSGKIIISFSNQEEYSRIINSLK